MQNGLIVKRHIDQLRARSIKESTKLPAKSEILDPLPKLTHKAEYKEPIITYGLCGLSEVEECKETVISAIPKQTEENTIETGKAWITQPVTTVLGRSE